MTKEMTKKQVKYSFLSLRSWRISAVLARWEPGEKTTTVCWGMVFYIAGVAGISIGFPGLGDNGETE